MNNFLDTNLRFIRERITQLRIKMNVSECKMSLDLYHSKSYIQNISSGHSMPSLQEFLCICNYLRVSPAEFFNSDLRYPQIIHTVIQKLPYLDKEDLELLLSLIDRLHQHTEP